MTTTDMSNETEAFFIKLINAVEQRSEKKQLQLDAKTTNQLKRFIKKGISNMSKEQVRSKKHQKEAEKNIIELVDIMEKNITSKQLDRSSDEIESIMLVSLRRFCPRFPFC